mmetsp:Transcript_41197/g.105333  ORF Transcript_41197/g.105333 Transcript_41197/m.105333 type:complete len:115 (-) Transcript_41197:321-665(-)
MTFLTAVNPLLLLFGPVLYILLALMGLMQFGVVFQAFTSFAKGKTLAGTVLEPLRPGLKNLASVMESWLGSAGSFKPNMTHVLLVSIFMVTMCGMEAIRLEIAKGNQKAQKAKE